MEPRPDPYPNNWRRNPNNIVSGDSGCGNQWHARISTSLPHQVSWHSAHGDGGPNLWSVAGIHREEVQLELGWAGSITSPVLTAEIKHNLTLNFEQAAARTVKRMERTNFALKRYKYHAGSRVRVSRENSTFSDGYLGWISNQNKPPPGTH